MKDQKKGGYLYAFIPRIVEDPVVYRVEIIQYAKQHGVKPAARFFKTTPKTVCKWLKRFDECKKPNLKGKSKHSHKNLSAFPSTTCGVLKQTQRYR